MAIFYTDSGSFNTLNVINTIVISGSLQLSNSAGGLTGSLSGSALTATSASYALSASYAPGAGGNAFGTVVVAGQNNVVADQTNDSLTLVAGTNISITTNDTTDTITINSTGGSSFPYTGSAAISGSLNVVHETTPQVRILGQATGSIPLAGTLLQVVASSSLPTRISIDTHNNDSTFGSSIRARRSRGTTTAPTALQSGDVLLQLVGDGHDGTDYQTNHANISFLTDENWSGTNRGTVVSVRTTPNGSIVSTASVNIRSDRVDITGSLGATEALLVGVSRPIRTPREAMGIYPTASYTSYNLVVASASVDNYIQFNMINASSGISASADFVATNNLGQLNETSYYIDMGINSSGHTTTTNAVGVGNDAYLYSTGRELLIGNASTGSNSAIRFFTNGFYSSSQQADLTIAPNGFVGIGIGMVDPSASLDVSAISGTIRTRNVTAQTSGGFLVVGGLGYNLNLNAANYFIASGSGTGVVAWTASGAPSSGTLGGFVLQYSNGAQLTNAWFANTRWPGGTAPTLTSGGVDLLGFSTVDAGANWRGVLLQRDSK
jgi:hypothetical protein